MPTKLLGAIVAASACLGADQTRRLTPQDFAPAETCKPCHTEIYQQWRASFHSQSAIDPVFWQMFQQALRDANIRASGLCLTCHAPVATVGMERSPVRPISLPLELSPIAREGVTCDFCHTISGEENLGKNVSLGAYRMPHKGETGVKYGTHPDATAPAHATRASAFLQSPQLCAICHGYTHPLPGLELQNTYAEWSYGPYRGQGRTCQACHMPAYAGKAANEGPDRPDIHAHVFQGGHTEMLKKAAVVSLWARLSDKAGGNRIRVDALITNAGSGHLMPTGIPGIRQLWLELAVKAPGGAEVFTGRASFGAVLVDR
ncbi:MAG: hypothetical protein HYR60_03345, partial [Acidobacteria bacterium]|nr:hypothetical protein [Acidobacteriota bacterium]